VQIADVTPEDAEVYGLEQIAGVRIDDFGEASPAKDAGLERHDVIVALGGERVLRVGQLQRMVALRSPGDTVRVSVVRWGRSLEVPVVLKQSPVTDALHSSPEEAPPAVPMEGLGIELAELDAASARELGYMRAGGAVIERVTPFGAADRKGISSGDRIVAIGRTSVRSAREARALLRAVGRGQVLSLLLETPGGRTYIANVRIP
jgi:serine protease Do